MSVHKFFSQSDIPMAISSASSFGFFLGEEVINPLS